MVNYVLQEQQAVSLTFLLLLSFVLPLTAARVNTGSATQLVWKGQLVSAIAGIAILIWPNYAYMHLIGAIAGNCIFVLLLARMYNFTHHSNDSA